MIGLVGCHRVGKSSLAKAFSEKTGLTFVPVQAGKVFEHFGIDPSQPMPFELRLALQRVILQCAESEWSHYPMGFVTDRTPLDMMAYTLADVGMDTITTESLERRLAEYLEACVEATRKHFKMLLLIQPGIEIVNESWKGATSEAYRNKLNWIMRGLMTDKSLGVNAHVLNETILDFDLRLQILERIYGEFCVAHKKHAVSYSPLTH